jgi:hypothetical protein
MQPSQLDAKALLHYARQIISTTSSFNPERSNQDKTTFYALYTLLNNPSYHNVSEAALETCLQYALLKTLIEGHNLLYQNSSPYEMFGLPGDDSVLRSLCCIINEAKTDTRKNFFCCCGGGGTKNEAKSALLRTTGWNEDELMQDDATTNAKEKIDALITPYKNQVAEVALTILYSEELCKELNLNYNPCLNQSKPPPDRNRTLSAYSDESTTLEVLTLDFTGLRQEQNAHAEDPKPRPTHYLAKATRY